MKQTPIQNKTFEKLPESIKNRPGYQEEFEAIHRHYRFGAPPSYLALGNPEDPGDPILRQILPSMEELRGGENSTRPEAAFSEARSSSGLQPVFASDSTADPLQEERFMPVAGLIHRYRNRALLLVSERCAVYCRFCTRKRRVLRTEKGGHLDRWDRNRENHPRNDSDSIHDSKLDTDLAVDYIKRHPEILEVILSGGEPLLRTDDYLSNLLDQITNIDHVVSVRIHTRIPVVQPERITDSLVQIFSKHYPLTLVAHFNHPRELRESSIRAIGRLRKSGVSILNQSVLLRGVNDDYETLKELMIGLWKSGVRPYYLHQCDPIPGTEHFHVEIEQGRKLIEELQQSLPGHIVPRYILDMPGPYGKIPLDGYRME